MSETQCNLKKFKIIHSRQFVQIVPQGSSFRTQLLINKNTGACHCQEISNQYQFPGHFSVTDASLILGKLQIEGGQFLLYAQNVYLQSALPPNNTPVYQIASVGYIQFPKSTSNRQKQILNTLRTEIFNFSFYFSFQRDLTLSLQREFSSPKPCARQAFFWNCGMLKALLKDFTQRKQWVVPVIQGHYSTFQMAVGNKQVSYYLLSRRSKYRSGTRFYNKGIDENSNCAQFIQTEQIILMDCRVFSFVCLSGTVPLFWQQKSQGDKLRLTRNKELTLLPFLQHLNNIHKENGNLLLVNLLEQQKDGENLLLQAYQQLVAQNMRDLQQYLRYVYFDISTALRKGRDQQVFEFIAKLQPLLKEFGYFAYDYLRKVTISTQKGVCRLSCLDCLTHTNRFMQLLCFNMMYGLLLQEGMVQLQSSHSAIRELLQGADFSLSTLVLGFRGVWQEKADFQSLIYAGTRATHGKKNKFLDDLQNSFVSLKRLYNQKYLDQTKQKALDVMLYHKHYRLNCMLRNTLNSELHLSIMTWNVNATSPEEMPGLQTAVVACAGTDLVVIGIQEMIKLNTNNVVSSNEEDSQISSAWEKQIQRFLNSTQRHYIFVRKVQMVGLLVMVFIAQEWKHAMKGVQLDSVKTGMGGQFGNKGAVVIRLRIFETTLCFTCCHLTAGQSKVQERIQDINTIHLKAFQQSKVGVQNENYIKDSDYQWLFGDLNFRVNGEFKQVKELLENCRQNEEKKNEAVSQLLLSDQLLKAKKDPLSNSYLTTYEEPQITFLPTYKLDKQTGAYTQQKERSPSWCDRILYSEDCSSCECVCYHDVSVCGSDHRPVVAKFSLIVNQMVSSSSKGCTDLL